MAYKHLDFTPLIIPFAVICAVIGWCVIELILWVFSFVSITLN